MEKVALDVVVRLVCPDLFPAAFADAHDLSLCLTVPAAVTLAALADAGQCHIIIPSFVSFQGQGIPPGSFQ